MRPPPPIHACAYAGEALDAALADYYICVPILLSMRAPPPIHVCAYAGKALDAALADHYICVLILLILLSACPHTRIYMRSVLRRGT